MNVLIIEDEDLIAENLKQCILRCRQNYKVIAVLHSVKAATDYLNKAHIPDCILFADVALGDGIVFDVFNKVKISYPVIFCTAYDKYAIEAFNTNGIDYILKPINVKRVEQAILKVENLVFNVQLQDEKIKSTYSQLVKPNVFLVHYRDKILPFDESSIAAFYIQLGIVYLLDFKGHAYPINKSLEEIETEVSDGFYRANRQIIVNRTAIKEIQKTDSRKLVLLLTVQLSEVIAITIGKEKVSEFKKWFEGVE